MTDKEYGYEIAKDLYSNMRLSDFHRYFGNSSNIVTRMSLGEVPFEEAENAVLKWREDTGVRRDAD